MPIPTPTIPGVAPETWTLLIQALQAQGTDVATITEQGIITWDQMRQWLSTQGYELIEISEVVGYTLAKVSAVDPANTNAVSTQVVTDIATVGGTGTAVSTVTSGGNKTLGLVTKAVAVGAALSLLVSTIGAGLVSDQVKEDLIFSADPYTIDGEHIPVLIDGNGNTHLMSEMVEAIRAKCIELGVFDAEGVEPTIVDPGTYTDLVLHCDSKQTARTVLNYLFTNPANSHAPFKNFGGGVMVTEIDTALARVPEPLNDHCFYVLKFINKSSSSGTTKRYGFYITMVDSDDVLYKASVSNPGTSSGVIMREVTSSTWSATHIGVQSGSSVSHVTIYPTESFSVNVYTSGGGVYSTETITPNNIKSTILPAWSNTNNAFLLSGHDVNRNSVGTESLFIANLRTTEPVEGLTPDSSLTEDMKDTTKTLTDIIPQLATGSISIAAPTAGDLIHKGVWYPISILKDDVFEDGMTSEETATAPDGVVSPDMEPDILDAIRDLIDIITPNPTIPVGDSGDTPPENPPLTPGSGATGSNGLWSIYNPSLQAVHDFGAWLWSDTLADQFRRIFNSPIDGVIGFHMIYCTPSKGTAKNIQCGFLQSPVVSDTVANQYVELDCGTVAIGEYYRNALDYDNTSIALYLPFIGIVPLDTRIVMGSDISILYRIDVLTGTCLAQVTVSKENSNAVMYAFDGNCSVQIPLTATTYTGMVGALLGGLSASVSFMAGDMFHAVSGAASAMASAMGGKTGVKQSGTMGANAGALGIRKPYVIITHPVTAMPAGFEDVRGLPSTELVTLGSLSGYTSVRDIHLEGIPATAEEINEIKELLAEGVIL